VSQEHMSFGRAPLLEPCIKRFWGPFLPHSELFRLVISDVDNN
jgi:hypothetical protein